MKKIFILIMAILICVGTIAGIATKRSFTDKFKEDSEWDTYRLAVRDVCPENLELDILDTADMIARVRFTGLREQKYQASLSTVDVLDVYRGDPQYVGQKINIYENGFFWIDGGFVNQSINNLMITGNEYYVFLYERDYYPLYQQTLDYDEFSAIYCGYACFPAYDTDPQHFNAEQPLTYGDVKEAEYICFTIEQYELIKRNEEVVKESFLGS